MNRDGIIRVGVIGIGFIAIPQMNSIRRIPGIELAAVCDPALGRLKEIKRAYGIEQGHAD